MSGWLDPEPWEKLAASAGPILTGLASLKAAMSKKKKGGKPDLPKMRAELDELKADFETLVGLMQTSVNSQHKFVLAVHDLVDSVSRHVDVTRQQRDLLMALVKGSKAAAKLLLVHHSKLGLPETPQAAAMLTTKKPRKRKGRHHAR